MTNTDLLGLSEIAELFNVHRNTANNWSRQRDFPLPVAQLKMGPVWSKADVVAWRTPAGQQVWKLACGSCASQHVFLDGIGLGGVVLNCYACDKKTVLEITQGNNDVPFGVSFHVKEVQ
jgi:predicted DNA-binding transcriptional regulator AlpA